MADVYSRVKDLPETVQAALRKAGYRSDDIGVRAQDTYSPAQSGGSGRRAFVVKVNLTTGETEASVGSWGGANMFNPGNAVDLDRGSYPIPTGVAVIEGSQGEKTFASLVVRPENLAPLLPGEVALSDRLSYILTVYSHYNSAGRKNEFERPYKVRAELRGTPTKDELSELVKLGLLAPAGSGMKVTAAGRNAAKRDVYSFHEPL